MVKVMIMITLSVLVSLIFESASFSLQSTPNRKVFQLTPRHGIPVSKRDQILDVIQNRQLNVKRTNTATETFSDYRSRLLALRSSTAKLNFFKGQGSSELFHFASIFDDLPDDSNNNINDKFWRAGLRFGKTNTSYGLETAPERFGPFVECAPFVSSSALCITISLSSFFTVRYLYEVQLTQSKLSSSKPATAESSTEVIYREFQWIFFGKLVYNRLINRRELWTAIHEDSDFSVIDIRNVDRGDDPYGRLAAFTSKK